MYKYFKNYESQGITEFHAFPTKYVLNHPHTWEPDAERFVAKYPPVLRWRDYAHPPSYLYKRLGPGNPLYCIPYKWLVFVPAENIIFTVGCSHCRWLVRKFLSLCQVQYVYSGGVPELFKYRFKYSTGVLLLRIWIQEKKSCLVLD